MKARIIVALALYLPAAHLEQALAETSYGNGEPYDGNTGFDGRNAQPAPSTWGQVRPNVMYRCRSLCAGILYPDSAAVWKGSYETYTGSYEPVSGRAIGPGGLLGHI